MKVKIFLLLVAVAVHRPALAQTGDTRATSATTKLGENKVTITVTGGERVITANGLPNHATGRFPNRGNPNAITEKNYQFHVPKNPKAAEKTTSASIAWFGVALNGVPFEPGTAEFWNEDRNWNYEGERRDDQSRARPEQRARAAQRRVSLSRITERPDGEPWR